MPQIAPPQRAPVSPEDHAAKEAAKKPGPSDVHEQRQTDQKAEAVVEKKTDVRPPTQSLIDEERGDWEGMGQGRHTPD